MIPVPGPDKSLLRHIPIPRHGTDNNAAGPGNGDQVVRLVIQHDIHVQPLTLPEFRLSSVLAEDNVVVSDPVFLQPPDEERAKQNADQVGPRRIDAAGHNIDAVSVLPETPDGFRRAVNGRHRCTVPQEMPHPEPGPLLVRAGKHGIDIKGCRVVRLPLKIPPARFEHVGRNIH